MLDFFKKFPFEGARTYISIVLLAIASLWPDIQMLLDGADSMSDMQFIFAAVKILIAIAGIIFRKIGKEKPQT